MLTLSQMADELNRSTKTFRKYVDEYSIPHIKLGRSMMFDPVAVSNHLASMREEPKQKVVRFTRKKVGTKFAEAVGI